jgi:hypothetical protein
MLEETKKQIVLKLAEHGRIIELAHESRSLLVKNRQHMGQTEFESALKTYGKAMKMWAESEILLDRLHRDKSLLEQEIAATTKI